MLKKLILFVFGAILLLPAYAQQRPDTLRVMTYNLRFGELASMKEIADYIKSENPDIVALQEVDWKTHRERAPRQHGVAMINELAFYTGMFGLYGKSIDYSGGYYGLGILSRYPILSSQRILLPNPEPQAEQRSMLMAQIEMPHHQPVTFICTHLEVATQDKRIAQIRFIQQEAKKIEGPLLLAGDFNARPDSEEIRTEMNGWINATDEEYTYHADNPTIKIDYIYFLPGRGLEMIDTNRGKAKLSDHLPVITNFRVQ